MSSETRVSPRKSLAFKLTLWYSACFAISAAIVFGAGYFVILSFVRDATDAELIKEMEEYSSILSSQGMAGLKAVASAEEGAEDESGEIVRLFDARGQAVITSRSGFGDLIPFDRALFDQARSGAPALTTVALAGKGLKYRILYASLDSQTTLQVAENLSEEEQILGRLWRTFYLTVIVATVLAGVVGWMLSRRATGSLESITRTAIDIAAGDLDRRAEAPGSGDEIDHLAVTFNGLVDRIQFLLAEMKAMMDSIAHDLRSPIARMRGAAELVLTKKTSPLEYEEMAASTVEECDWLLGLINANLAVSEAEAGLAKVELEEVALDALVAEVCELFEPAAEEKGTTLRVQTLTPCLVRGDRQHFQRVVANLVDNALKYTPSGGSVTASVTISHGNARLTIEDSGIGIPSQDLPHVFERFFRGPQVTSAPGHGLGLSLARALVTLHGGEISAASQPGKGSIFTVTLPAQPSA